MEFYPSQKVILALKIKERNKESHSLEFIVDINSIKACYY